MRGRAPCRRCMLHRQQAASFPASSSGPADWFRCYVLGLRWEGSTSRQRVRACSPFSCQMSHCYKPPDGPQLNQLETPLLTSCRIHCLCCLQIASLYRLLARERLDENRYCTTSSDETHDRSMGLLRGLRSKAPRSKTRSFAISKSNHRARRGGPSPPRRTNPK